MATRIFSAAHVNGIAATIALSVALASGQITKAQRPRIEHYSDRYGDWARIVIRGEDKGE